MDKDNHLRRAILDLENVRDLIVTALELVAEISAFTAAVPPDRDMTAPERRRFVRRKCGELLTLIPLILTCLRHLSYALTDAERHREQAKTQR